MLNKFIIKRYFQILASNFKIHGFFSRPFFFWLLGVPPFLLFNYIGMQLDNIFYRKYKEVKLDDPIFIMAHPRSGTTLLHRAIVDSGNYLAFEYWELRFPALSTRKLVKTIVNFLVKIKKDTVIPKSVGHYTTLRAYEEEDLLLLLLMDTSFVDIFSSLMINDTHNFPIHDLQEHRYESVKFLKECFKRQAYYYGKTKLVTKMNYSILRIETIAELFPDARFIYILRDPVDAIPSHLTLREKTYEHICKCSVKPAYYEAKKTELMEKQYQFNLLFYRHFYDAINKGALDKNRVLEVLYDDLTNNFEQVMAKINGFAALNLTEQDKERIHNLAEQQKTYKRPHTVNPLEDFGITAERIKKDLAFLYKKGKLTPVLSSNQEQVKKISSSG